MKKGCIFDLDGTLVDSLLDLALSCNKVLEHHGLPAHDVSVYKTFVGNGIKKLVERALGDNHQEILEQCLDEFSSIYENSCLEHTLPYQGMKELIEELHKEGYKLAVVTNKPHHLAI